MSLPVAPPELTAVMPIELTAQMPEGSQNPPELKPRRRNWLRWVLVTSLVCLLLTAVISADRIAARYAERTIAQRVKQALHTETEPRVDVEGIPFLTQVISKKLTHVVLRLDEVTLRHTTMTDAQLDLFGVNGDGKAAQTADRLTGKGTLGWSAIAEKTGTPVEFAAPDRIRAQRNVEIFGRELQAVVYAKPVLDQKSQTVIFSELDINVSGRRLAAEISRQLVDTYAKPVPLSLPAPLQATSVKTQQQGLVVEFTADSVDLTRLN